MEKLLEPRLIISGLMIVGIITLAALGQVESGVVTAFFAGILARFGNDKATKPVKREDKDGD
jgi:hypothetical protein